MVTVGIAFCAAFCVAMVSGVAMIYGALIVHAQDVPEYDISCDRADESGVADISVALGVTEYFSITKDSDDFFPLAFEAQDDFNKFNLAYEYGGEIVPDSESGSAILEPQEVLCFKVSLKDDAGHGEFRASYIFYNYDDPTRAHEVVVMVSATVEAPKPAVTGVVITPSGGTAQTGKSYSFKAEVKGENLTDKSVSWSVNGNNSPYTYVTAQDDYSAVLTIGSDESASSITVVATANQEGLSEDSRRSAAVSLTVQKSAVYVDTQVSDYSAGTITSGSYVTYGGSYDITAKANTGYKFVRFVENGNTLSQSSSIKLSNITFDREIMAEFEKSKYTIKASISPASSGWVDNLGTYEYGEQVWLRAVPNDGYDFVSWVVSGQTVSTDVEYLTKALEADMTITANFKKQEARKIMIASGTADNGGRISPDGENLVEEGKSATYKMIPDTGYRVAAVAVDGVSIGAVETYTFSNVYEEHSIAVSFEKIPEETLRKTSTNTTGTTSDSNGDAAQDILEDDTMFSVENLEDEEMSEEEMARIASEAEDQSEKPKIIERRTIIEEPEDTEEDDSSQVYILEDEETAKAASADALLDSDSLAMSSGNATPRAINLTVIRIVVAILMAIVCASIGYTYYWLFTNTNQKEK